ncbi:hypothetical protein HK405_002261, partial [Cladochytrium tenue]
CSNLTTLNFSSSPVQCPLTPPSPTAFRALQIFEAANTSVGDDDLRTCVGGIASLRVLNLSRCPAVTVTGIRWLGLGCPHLASVTLSPSDHERDVAVAKAVMKLGSEHGLPLETLELADFGLTDATITGGLRGFYATLTILRLSGNKITEAGLTGLAGMQVLAELYLDRTLVSDAIVDELLSECSTSNPSLDAWQSIDDA